MSDIQIKPDNGEKLIGPFNDGDYYTLVHEGRIIPYFKAQKMDKDKPEDWYLSFDGRIIFGPMTKETIDQMCGPLAFGMAFAAGYACPSAETKFNPHNGQIHGIFIPPKLSVVPPSRPPSKDESQ